MFVRGSRAVVLGVVLSSAALAVSLPALAGDGGPAKNDPVTKTVACSSSSHVKIRATVLSDGAIEAVGVVFSNDVDRWTWKFKHNGDFSAMGVVRAKPGPRSFRVVRTMVDLSGPDEIFFRAENHRTDEVCKVHVTV